MYCFGIIKPCDRPCGFVEPVFQDDDNGQLFLCTTTPQGTIASFVPYDGSYPIETNGVEKQAPYNTYRVADPAPLAFVFYNATTPTLVLGSRTRVVNFLAHMITRDKGEMPIEAKYKAAQVLGSKNLPQELINAIYYSYYMHLSHRNSRYAEMWKAQVKSSEGIDIRCPEAAKTDENIVNRVAEAIYEIFVPSSHIVGIAFSAKSNAKRRGLNRFEKLMSPKEIIMRPGKNAGRVAVSTHKLLLPHHLNKKVSSENRIMVKSVKCSAQQIVIPNSPPKVYLAKRMEPTKLVVVGEKIDMATSLERKEKTTIVVID